MEQVRSLIFDCYNQLIQQSKPVSIEAVKSLYLGEDIEERVTILKLIAYHKQVSEHKLAAGTIKNYHTTVILLPLFGHKNYR